MSTHTHTHACTHTHTQSHTVQWLSALICLLNENKVEMDGLVAIWITVRVHAQAIAFQTGLLRGRGRKEERISEMSILHGEQRHLFMRSPSACIVVSGQAGVETSPGRTEEFRWLLKASFSKIRTNDQ